MEPIQLLTPAGELCTNEVVSLDVTPELCREFYRRMTVTRAFDQAALALQRQGELGLWLMSLGQEASQIGSVAALRGSDYVFPSYREHGVALYRGVSAHDLLALWRGVALSGWDPAVHRFHVYTLVLATQMLHATGYAMGVKLDKADEAVLVYFGDGSASEGDANEAFNWAAVMNVPLVFFCQNNHWAISTPVTRQTGAPLYKRGEGFGLASYLVDGNDVFAVYALTKMAAEHARSGQGPALIEALTYRIAGHSTSDDPRRYRSTSEVEDWQGRDPIDRVHRLLERKDWGDPGFFKEVDEEGATLADEARQACLTMLDPEPLKIFSKVYADMPPSLAAQRDSFRSYLELFE